VNDQVKEFLWIVEVLGSTTKIVSSHQRMEHSQSSQPPAGVC